MNMIQLPRNVQFLYEEHLARLEFEGLGWLRRHVPEPVARYGALTLVVLFGCFSVAQALLAGPQ